MVHILFLEDNADDVELMQEELRGAALKFTSVRVDKRDDFSRQLRVHPPGLILADYSLPRFDGMEAFRILKRRKLNIPFILVTGALSEQVALECVKEGVDDFILKSSFKRLPAAIRNAIEKKKMENEKARMAQALKKTNIELQLLTERLHVSREEERLILARDLHDELGQVLTGLKIELSMLRKRMASGKISDPTEVDTEFQSMVGLVEQVTRSVRRISSGLRPEILDELGVVEAIRWMCQDFELRNKVTCQAYLDVNGLDFDRNFSIALYRIIQEGLTNVIRHAQASHVEVHMSISGETLNLIIKDDGIGISDEEVSDSNSLGLIGLRERTRILNGRFGISGRRGRGTKIEVMVPLNQTYAVEQN